MSKSRLIIQTVRDTHHVSFTDSRIMDESSIRAIYTDISELVAIHSKIKLILDLGHVSHLSSALLGKLVALNKEVKAAKGQMALANIQPSVLEVFRITKLDKVLDIRKDAATAMNAFG